MSKSGKKELEEQVLKLILFQGNRFIKELLRQKNLRIGATKSEFQKNILKAINDELLTQADIENWLQEIEGWGDQHAFVLKVPRTFKEDPKWKNAADVEKLIKKGGYEKFWNRETVQIFPEEMELTSIKHSSAGLRFIWHQAISSTVRATDLEEEIEEVDGEEIVWRPYKRTWGRALMYFDWRFDLGLAGIFLRRSIDQPDDENKKEEIIRKVHPIVDVDNWQKIDISSAIRNLDDLDLNKSSTKNQNLEVRSTSTQFTGTAAWIKMASLDGNSSYQEDISVRSVRRAMNIKNFTGASGDFRLKIAALRDLHVRLYGKLKRISLWGSMTADEVWSIVKVINDLS